MLVKFTRETYKLLFAVFCCLSVSFPVIAEPRVGIIIPELRAPFKVIFDTVSDGVDDGFSRRPSRLVLSKDYDPREITRWIKKEDINSVVTLGGVGRKAAAYVPSNIDIVLGALLSSPGPTNKYPGVALTPNPKSLFVLLKKLDKKRNKIIVVYNSEKSQWKVDLAKKQISAMGMQLIAYQAANIKESATIYDDIFSNGDLENTALWLLQDRKVVDSKVVLPFILEKAWQKKIVVFSSALSHVKKGVLFSMYPDNKSHGKQLADLVASKKSRTSDKGMLYPTYGLKNAINFRTAEHLGLNISRSELRDFDLVFPVSN
ncbi:MAG: ABC transporter substrate binding protein [Gammaproteobacteria bacterium]